MTNKVGLKKKFLSTLMIGLIVLGGSLAITSVASAKFIIRGGQGLITGIITDANRQNKTFTFDTNGTNPTVIQVTEDTKFFGASEFGAFAIGDKVDVRGYRENGVNYATSVRKLDPSGYGYGGGKAVMLSHATLLNKQATSFSVKDGLAPITFIINGNTTFVGKSYAQLQPGDKLRVIGTDVGTGFYAKTVTFLSAAE